MYGKRKQMSLTLDSWCVTHVQSHLLIPVYTYFGFLLSVIILSEGCGGIHQRYNLIKNNCMALADQPMNVVMGGSFTTYLITCISHCTLINQPTITVDALIFVQI